MSLQRNALLFTDARMIAEDDTHVVLSIRVPKKYITDNMPLIRSALDAALDRGPRLTTCHRPALPAAASPSRDDRSGR
ncbi:hypothetical protein ACVWW6_005567 [Bradyrhizobium sp. USDA 3311]